MALGLSFSSVEYFSHPYPRLLGEIGKLTGSGGEEFSPSWDKVAPGE